MRGDRASRPKRGLPLSVMSMQRITSRLADRVRSLAERLTDARFDACVTRVHSRGRARARRGRTTSRPLRARRCSASHPGSPGAWFSYCEGVGDCHDDERPECPEQLPPPRGTGDGFEDQARREDRVCATRAFCLDKQHQQPHPAPALQKCGADLSHGLPVRPRGYSGGASRCPGAPARPWPVGSSSC
jgi:hypothetical protein